MINLKKEKFSFNKKIKKWRCLWNEDCFFHKIFNDNAKGRQDLERHIMTHYNFVFKCSICKSTFK